MLKPSLRASNRASSLLPRRSTIISGTTPISLPICSLSARHRTAPRRRGHVCCKTSNLSPIIEESSEKQSTVKVVVTAKAADGGFFAHLGLNSIVDDVKDLLGRSLLIELVSAQLDPTTGLEKETIQGYVHKTSTDGDDVSYEGSFAVPVQFGDIGGVLVTNEHHKEMWLQDITVLSAEDDSISVSITCKSWVHSKSDDPTKRAFFSNKSYLPSKTPGGLRRLRAEELEIVRGDGTGERKTYERIYDYDTYNDLGDPDRDEGTARPVLGGSKEFPYPRRCRTGRPRTKKDPLSESRSGSTYVPRDEDFSKVKDETFTVKTLRSVLHALVPSLETAVFDPKLGFPHFTAIDSLFKEGVKLPKLEGAAGLLRTAIPRLIRSAADAADNVLLFEIPAMIDKDKFSWIKDEEFTRQTLAGLNPYSIQLVTEFPLASKLDPQIYGSPESEITEEIIDREIKGIMTTKEAVEQNRLFVIDYHDLLLPFVNKVRQLEGTTLYGSRTLFFLNLDGTLRPVAIELTRPPSPTKPQWKRVFTNCWDATGMWLWKLAKAHVCAHDSGHHQLISHWLRTHACTEPYVIATNRQLSAMHPIYRLLHPHFRYTMEINALAREFLINADGIIEQSFSPAKYSMQLSSAAYQQLWRFDMEALPADLVRRGMAIEDPTAEHGIRLTIKDYPFAADGLLIWSAIEKWVVDYVSHYYRSSKQIEDDYELQGWWTEVRTKGHADKKDEPWWPALNTPNDLTQILTIIIWVASGHHAAVNFGQYHFAGYFPNRPAIARENMPVEDGEDDEKFDRFFSKPEDTLLRCFPSQIQAMAVMAVIDVLSSHSPDEEYLGGAPESAWAEDPTVRAAFERFSGRMREVEGIIDNRNCDKGLLNRCGAGIVPYELLKPFSGPGVTGMGIPNSISI